MASIWVETKDGGTATRLEGRLHPKVASAKFQQFVQRYLHGKAGRKARFYHAHEALLFDSKGGLFGLVWVEFMSPPSAPEPGQPKRAVTS
jgi:hypothetical protein